MIKYVILGIVQGITEFLPVSSSAHLVIFQNLLGIPQKEVSMAVVLHIGTILALIVFFFRDILSLLRNARSIGQVAIVTLITGVVGISGKGFFEKAFGSLRMTAFFLIVTGIILLFTRGLKAARKNRPDIKDAFVLGIAQALAILPGISRSGITISTLLFRGLDRQASFRFSFLAAIPAVLGAALLEIKEISLFFFQEPQNFAIGLACSFFSGIITLWFLRFIIKQARLYYFGYYCIFAAVVTLIFLR
ncbi:MAG: undecaprenyl-diphosphate phosphatase [Candidatus Omnitrophota bacterium]